MNRHSSGSVGSRSSAHTPPTNRPLGHSRLTDTPLTDTPPTSASAGRAGTPASDRILSGRVKKTPRKVARRKEDVLSEKEKEEERRQLDEMDEERKLFPGSDNWAEDEHRLFRILYMRQYCPLLPSHWDMDFRGIPIPDILFASSDAHPPVINSRSGNDFKATRALARLIELTGHVRGLCQTRQRYRARMLIERELQEYTKWAEQDGEYGHLDYLPNLIIDMVDTKMTPQAIEEHMQLRLKAAAATHRAHWRSDEMESAGNHKDMDERELKIEDDEDTEPEDNRVVLVPDKYPTPSPQKPHTEPPSTLLPNGVNNVARDHKLPSAELDSPAEGSTGECDKLYTRRPPVLYGLFIVNTSVMVLTIDSAKEGDEAYVSYQVEVGFSKRYQAVWNAITIAIVVCLARDAMVDMKEGFGHSMIDGDSDPDA
ncbi:hypothetical protein CGRA01v4_02884 [Colletotrichum graminicola]|uniref:Uncharacterized protein n=1 Tax=Colletotrichum graminicola (strain M1.001 / M2 / FGSC 10212) TaxID=645133 RepID=E3QA23_COLGM|nr:uncharacterized protein GLRG_02855 [Colletotrichum graminicola M1.001]EFQ27711.1 hypothetical protein GLRG_02855 [Colletotrichum graminicola M1.001]WDK11605.1 hypothetical protein CGRA01v4_02884 [Colletotrichum graminicola]